MYLFIRQGLFLILYLGPFSGHKMYYSRDIALGISEIEHLNCPYSYDGSELLQYIYFMAIYVEFIEYSIR